MILADWITKKDWSKTVIAALIIYPEKIRDHTEE